MNLLISTDVETDKRFKEEGHTFLGAADLRREPGTVPGFREIHIFQKKEEELAEVERCDLCQSWEADAGSLGRSICVRTMAGIMASGCCSKFRRHPLAQPGDEAEQLEAPGEWPKGRLTSLSGPEDTKACREYREDPCITDDCGAPKGQCVCGWPEEDHTPSALPPIMIEVNVSWLALGISWKVKASSSDFGGTVETCTTHVDHGAVVVSARSAEEAEGAVLRIVSAKFPKAQISVRSLPITVTPYDKVSF